MEGLLVWSLTIFAVMGFFWTLWTILNWMLPRRPTARQRALIQRLYAERDTRTVKFSAPKTREEASQVIDRLSACPYRED